MTEEGEARTDASSPTGEKHRADPYGLYRRWFDALEGARGGANGDTLDLAEFEKLWKRWLEKTVLPRGGTAEMEDDSPGGMASLWAEMAKDASAKMLDGEGLSEDPLRSFVRWYKDTEERWSERADEILRDDEALDRASSHLEAYAHSYDELRRASEEGLKKLRVPTGSDVARVAKLVVIVENKVDRIEEALEEFVYGDAEPATAGAVDSLEERMDRLEGKMDRILASLERLEAREEPEASPQPATEKDQRSAGKTSAEANDPGYS